MAAYWTNFARGGDPNVGVTTPLSIRWPRALGGGGGEGAAAARPLTALQLGLPALSLASGRNEVQCAFVEALGALPYPPKPPGVAGAFDVFTRRRVWGGAD